ncbi:MAG: VOC family protein [Silicimonas sp.]|jgi:catechol 2,3-dioxygenase-like lactoylglutathione lyase family enzyme|nr:VOC family protein [Silicimonas sp.]
MPIKTLDHVNIVTANVEDMTEWYEKVLGLKKGPRPNFSVAGAWLYVGENPYVHLVKIDAPRQPSGVQLEHFAFGATGMAEFLETLETYGVEHTVDPVPGYPLVQINFRDPEGNHIHVDFHDEEMAETS